MKSLFAVIILAVAITLLSAQTFSTSQQPMVQVAMNDLRTNTRLFAASTMVLENNLIAINPNSPESVTAARNALKACRYRYKAIEFILQYFFKSAAHIYNAPAKIEVEEPELEYEEPVGFQLIESLLYAPITPVTKHQMAEQAEAVRSSAQDISSLFYQFDTTDDQLLESIRQELIRIEVLNITGYDAPLLKSGINESASALKAIGNILAIRKHPRINQLIEGALSYIHAHPNFDRFNRLHFITSYISPLQKVIGVDLFDRHFLKADSFSLQQSPSNTVMLALGKKLFSEKVISGNGQRSCASCHQPGKYFSDGLAHSITLDGHGTVPRNAPTLLYAAYQYSQDWDGKARSIEDQVLNVMHNKDEMAADSANVVALLNNSASYKEMFRQAFSAQRAVSITNLATAIAAYIRTLAPFNSAFDRYIQGNHKAMNAAQINGFNLFMGKAQCGTCHFAPIFNGLTPPDFKATEYEVLGIPIKDDLKRPHLDPDLGRFVSYPSKYYRWAFKTPTVRNIAKTAPYMHNGGFHNLEAVLNFYNKGGGQGIGLNIPEQTLAKDKLNLTPKEIKDIISFLQALSDTI